MSSFVIGKVEYVKAAGAVAGIVEGFNHGNNECFVYDYQSNTRYTADGFYRLFVECFEMNALSVHEQYRHHPGEELWTDNADYMQEFRKYQKIGRSAAYDDRKREKIIFDLRDFMRSAMYQTEKEAYFFKMMMAFNQILVALMGTLNPHECECWGDFNAE